MPESHNAHQPCQVVSFILQKQFIYKKNEPDVLPWHDLNKCINENIYKNECDNQEKKIQNKQSQLQESHNAHCLLEATIPTPPKSHPCAILNYHKS